ncbi:unnamed protein product [Effrenium voratum]|uniref:Ubiquitin conjugation factor E4 core domain-containing protein n=1 Tax=Effrenium voratum TaxID=2562239 RepID=A0AA36NFE0_9DINO|nr:unnamed protein product [Effrenium voratum]CAJ1458317.1 unnamed protein product [Effrenium voratum]
MDGYAAPRDAAKESAMLCRVLSADLSASDLAELAADLDAESKPRLLDVENVERVLMAKLSARAPLAEKLKYLRECSRTCEEVRRDARYPQPVMQQLPKVHQMIGNYGALSMTCAELFGHDTPAPEQASACLQSMHERRELTIFLLDAMASAMEEPEQLAAIFGPFLDQACARLKGRNLVDQKLEEFRLIADVSATKGPLAKLLVTLPAFRPSAAPAAPNPLLGMMAGASGSMPQPGMGWRLQSDSLLGWILSPTCIDSALYKEQSARAVHFARLGSRSRASVESVQRLLRDTVQEVLRQGSSVIAPLLRAGEATRNAVVAWFAALVTGSQARTKSANLMDQGQGPQGFMSMLQSSPMPFDMQLQMQIMKAQTSGYATSGLCVNSFWAILELVKPIKLAQVSTLEPFYLLREGAHDREVIGGFLEEPRFGDTEEVEKAREVAAKHLAEASKFPTQIFWLALRAFHVLLVPVMKENLCMVVAASYFHGKNMQTMETAMGEHLVHEAILGSSSFLGDLGAFLNLAMAFFLCAALPDKAADILGGKVQGSVLTDEVSPQWLVLPSCILEDIIEVLEILISIHSGKGQPELFLHLDATLLLFLITFILGSGHHVKNPNLRGKAATIMKGLTAQSNFRHLVENSPVLANDIVPGCIRVFTAVEKTKQSFYDIRMQLKYQLRIPIMELFERVLPLEAHQKALKSFATENPDEFLKFLNNLMNDATMQLEEGMDTLIEIRRLSREGKEVELSRPAPSSVAEDEQTTEGADLYARSRADPKAHCKQYMQMGHRTISTLWSISREAPMVVTSKLNVLQQLLHNCLNSCLDRLVGPRCLELKAPQKGQANDFEEYSFKPKELLQMIAEMYIFVARADREKVQKMITEDGRSYQPKTFQKAVSILRREQMIAADLLKEFSDFVQELNALAESQEAALANAAASALKKRWIQSFCPPPTPSWTGRSSKGTSCPTTMTLSTGSLWPSRTWCLRRS